MFRLFLFFLSSSRQLQCWWHFMSLIVFGDGSNETGDEVDGEEDEKQTNRKEREKNIRRHIHCTVPSMWSIHFVFMPLYYICLVRLRFLGRAYRLRLKRQPIQVEVDHPVYREKKRNFMRGRNGKQQKLMKLHSRTARQTTHTHGPHHRASCYTSTPRFLSNWLTYVAIVIIILWTNHIRSAVRTYKNYRLGKVFRGA